MSELDERVREALKRVKGPDLQGSIIDQDLVSPITVSDGTAMFSIAVPADQAEELAPLQAAAKQVAEEVEGIEKAIVVLTAERKPGSAPASSPPPSASPLRDGDVRASTMPPPQSPASPAAPKRPNGPSGRSASEGASTLPPGVSHIIAVASGKGGVGKSTTAVNLAAALKLEGMSVGVLDADIYGPSMPRLLGLSRRPTASPNGNLQPLVAHGLKVMSMGLLVEEDTPMIWRGPMVIQALTQMLKQVDWGMPDSLDVIVIDMPPGTGDVALTLAQSVPLSGAVIVSTPQDVALIDAKKAVDMFQKLGVPLLGLIENMSTYVCPECGHEAHVFGHGGARAEAERLGVPFLGEIPLDIDIRLSSDGGTPIVVSKPKSPQAARFRDIAAQLAKATETVAA